ncbi:cell wall / vacuolar inhibitor of fructosidase 2-like [Capsicum chacoense]
MFKFISPVEVILLESILHDWSDDYCIKILKKCKEAISGKENGGRLIIIDTVMDHNPDCKSYETQLFMDMLMMIGVNGKERSEQEWAKLFSNADFTDYNIILILGLRSVIEDLIDDACHRTGDFNLCVASLRTDPHSRTADIKGLTCIMMEMCLYKAKGISSQIERIIKQATDRGFKECLEICLKEFGLAIDNHLPYAIKQLDSGDYVDATYSLMGVDSSAETCENQFTDPSVFTSPLTDVDAKFLNLTLVTGVLMSLLK